MSQHNSCARALGFKDTKKGVDFWTIIESKKDKLGYDFYPKNSEFYYKDPAKKDLYIGLDEYFHYMKTVRVEELTKIAQSVGATYLKISLKEEHKTFTKSNKGSSMKGREKGRKGDTGTLSGEIQKNTDEYTELEVAREINYKGSKYKKPTLQYFRHDPEMEHLIEACSNKNNPILEQTQRFSSQTTLGLKKKDALELDGLIKALKLQGNTSFTSEVERESRIIFEYTIKLPKMVDK